MRNTALLLVLLACLGLSACGMNRAVGVLPNTLDDLERETRELRDPAAVEPGTDPRP